MDMTNPHNAGARAYSSELDIRITDSSLRDGSHHKRHQFSVEDVRNVVSALDGAGVPVIEVTHGDGLGGASFNYASPSPTTKSSSRSQPRPPSRPRSRSSHCPAWVSRTTS